MALLDPAAAAATAGDVNDLMWMGKVLCWLITACHETRDVTRAQEWCTRVETICHDRDLVPLLHVCLIQYASVQVAAGTWVSAEKELTQTVGRLAGSGRTSRLEAVVQLGELRRRQGRLEEAEPLFKQAEFDPVSIIGVALIRHAEGQSLSAWSSLQGLLRTMPSNSRLARADVLLPAVRIAHAVGQDDSAALAALELRATATAVRTDALLAMSALADSVLAQPPDDAILLHEAVQEQLTAAIQTMTDIGTRQDACGSGSCRRHWSVDPPAVLTAREVEVLRLVSRGLSNEQIGRTLFLSQHTVHRHVANILIKLDQPTRAAAVSHALSTGIM